MDEDLCEVFQCAGCALRSAQFMEKELACLLLIPRMAKLGRFPSEEEIQQTIARFDRMTFGNLVHQIKEIGVTDELSGKLQEALDKRNFLAHHFFDVHRKGPDDSSALEVMKEDLSGMKSLFDEMFEGFHLVNFRLMRELGICTESGELIPEH